MGVRLALGGVGEEGAHLPGLGDGQGVKLGGEVRPLGVGVHRQAAVQADGDVKGLPQLLPVLGGDEQPALGVDIVLILPDHGSPPAFPALSAALLEGLSVLRLGWKNGP